MIWEHIIKNNYTTKSAKHISHLNTSSSRTLSTTPYSELEFIEHTICAFILKYPNVLTHTDYIIKLTDITLDELKEWMIEFMLKYNHCYDYKNFEQEIKNTRFYDTYILLSSSEKLFLDIISCYKDIDQQMIFKWLCKKHYLLILQQEYTSLSRDHPNVIEEKFTAYLQEIRKISEELKEINAILVS
jgi:hypothetical protein